MHMFNFMQMNTHIFLFMHCMQKFIDYDLSVIHAHASRASDSLQSIS